nr:hypothetical protein [Vibrio navarrensis]
MGLVVKVLCGSLVMALAAP